MDGLTSRILGVKYQSTGLSFCQIRDDLPGIVGVKPGSKDEKSVVTVPTLRVKPHSHSHSQGQGRGGGDETTGKERFISDSWDIAEYLNAAYFKHSTSDSASQSPNAQFASLFPDDQSRTTAKSWSEWADTKLSMAVRGFVLPKVYLKIDQPSQCHFLQTKFKNDPAALRAFSSRVDDPATRPDVIKEAIQVLRELEAALDSVSVLKSGSDIEAQGGQAQAHVEVEREGEGGEGAKSTKRRYIAGVQPTHVDSEIFGWYVFHHVNDPESAKEIWESVDLPRVQEWVKRLRSLAGI